MDNPKLSIFPDPIVDWDEFPENPDGTGALIKTVILSCPKCNHALDDTDLKEFYIGIGSDLNSCKAVNLYVCSNCKELINNVK